MPDVLISYSRRDKDFVSRLHSALTTHKYDVWIDWEDIPVSADWWEEITEGIEGSNTILFIVSPASLTSSVCAMELAHAISCNKHIIPLVYVETEINEAVKTLAAHSLDESVERILGGRSLVELVRANWRAIVRHNWLFFTDPNQFEISLNKLIEALTLDLDYVKAHTRFLTRAKEWEEHNYQDSFLLKGVEISDAEKWLTVSGGKEPKPTELHTEYIISSRAVEQRRNRRLLISASIGLVVVSILAILSFLLYHEAEANYNRANFEAQVALSGRTALQGLIELDQQKVDTALLLSLAALNIHDNRESRSSLLTGLQSVSQLKRISHDHTTEVRAVACAPDGRSYATADSSGVILLWQTDSGAAPVHLQHGGRVRDLAFSPDGHILVSAGTDGMIQRWDIATGEPLDDPLSADGDPIYSIAFSPDGQMLASAHDDGFVRLWNIQTGELIRTLEGHTDRVYAVDFSPDGTQLASGGGDFQILLWDLSDNTAAPTALEGHTNWVWSVDFSPDGTRLVSGGQDSTVRLWDVNSREQISQPLTDHTAGVWSVVYSPDGQTIASASADHRIILRDAADGNRYLDLAPLMGHANEVFDLAFSPDSQTLISVGEDAKVLTWTAHAYQPLVSETIESADWYYNAALSPDGNWLAAGGRSGTLLLQDRQTGEITEQAAIEPIDITSTAWRADSSLFAYATALGKIVTVTMPDKTPTVLIDEQGFAVLAIAFSPDGKLLAYGGDNNQVALWDFTQNNIVPLGSHEDRVTSAAFSPDGKWLVSAGYNSEITVWDVNKRTLLRKLPQTHSDDVTAVEFSHDGKLLASASRDNSVILWDTQTWQPLEPFLTGHTDYVLDVAFSPDDTLLASGGYRRDQHIILWDVASRQALGQPLTAHHGSVYSVTFNSTGTQVISSSDDKTIRVWDITLERWKALACQIANRELTATEWVRYLPTMKAMPLCKR